MPLKLHLEKTTLPNGLRILTCAMPHTYSVGVGFYLSIGSRYESEELAGASHFVEHMLFKGTTKYPTPQAIAALLEGHGGVFNASTGQETTMLWAKMPQAHLDLALDVLCDMLRHSVLQPDEVEKERRVILEEISASQDVPEELVSLVLNEITWPDHPLGRDVAGTPESVAGLSRNALHRFMSSVYRPQEAVLSVAGNVQHTTVVELAQRLLGDWEPGPAPTFAAAPPDGTRPRVAWVQRPIEQAHLALHLPGLSRADPDRYALSLLNIILGEGMSSRLFLELRERLGLAYAVDSYTSLLTDTGVLGVYAAVAPEQAHAALAAVLRELARLRDEAVDADTLHLAREYSKGRLLLGLEDTLAVAGWFGRQEVLREEILSPEAVIEKLEAVTAADIQRVAGRIVRPAGACLAGVGPQDEQEADSFEEVLATGPLAGA